jgi:hypothetical protein
LEPAGARAVAGVGSEDGTFTASSEHAPGEHGSRVFCIDPYPTPALVTLAESAPEIELFKTVTSRPPITAITSATRGAIR